MICSKNLRDINDGTSRHYGNLARGCGGLRGVETVRVYTSRTRKRKAAEKKEEAGEPKVAVRSPALKRACADCRSTSTPLWRRGPSGPRSLCNACGIRFRRGLVMDNTPTSKNESICSYSLSPSSSSLTATTEDRLRRYEEMKQRQKEKQMKMLLLLGWTKMKNETKNMRKIPIKTKTTAVTAGAAGGGCGGVSGEERTEAEDAALLLMSLSSGIFVHQDKESVRN